MDINVINLRRFIRNRIEYYATLRDSHCVGVIDGCPLTLRQLCHQLTCDQEPLPYYCEGDMKKLCGSDYASWWRSHRTYGDLANVLKRRLAEEDGTVPPVGEWWVSDALNERSHTVPNL